jgi:hypothetical protein
MDQVPDSPAPIRRLDSLFSAALIAHEAIFEMSRELTSSGRAEENAAELLADSARITLTDLPTVAAGARDLAARWEEQCLLDPRAAEETADALAAEVARMEPELRGLMERQRQIAMQLRAMLDR